MHHNELSLQLLDWLDSEFESRVKQHAASVPKLPHVTAEHNSSEKVMLPKVNLEEVKSRNHESIGAGDSSQPSSTKHNQNASSSATGQQQSNSSRTTPRGIAGASVSYKERRDLYKMKSSTKVRESTVAANTSTTHDEPHAPSAL